MSASLVTQVTTTLLALSGWPVYALVGGLAFAESGLLVGLVVPGETAVLLGGVLAAQHHVALVPLLVVVVVAAVLGDVTGFFSGRRLGPRLRQGRLGRRIGDARWDRVAGLLERRGTWAVVLGRWVGLLRALTPTVAGASGMPMRRFLPASLLGASSWAVTVVLLGYFAGASLAGVQSVLGALTGAALLVGALAVVGGWIRSRRARRAVRRSEAAGQLPAEAPDRALAHVGGHAGP